MAKKTGLGRGLDALIGPESLAQKTLSPNPSSLPHGIEADKDGTLWCDVALLKPNPHQMRKKFDDALLAELSDSIKEHGIVEPIIIDASDEANFFIIAGERRTRAAKLAGLKKVPVQLRRYDEQKKLEIALIENIQRTDLNPIEEASAYYNLMQLGDLNQDEVAKRVGKSRSAVANALRLLKLPKEMQGALIDGSLTSGHARALLSLTNERDMQTLFSKIITEKLSVREAEKFASSTGEKKANAQKAKKDERKKDADLQNFEQRLLEKFGTKCSINGDRFKGFIRIDYFSKADLDRLFALLLDE